MERDEQVSPRSTPDTIRERSYGHAFVAASSRKDLGKSQLWIQVFEGKGLPESLKESHIVLKTGDHHISGKSAKRDSSNPKWGDTFVVSRFTHDHELIIEVRATGKHALLSSVLFKVPLLSRDIIDSGQLYKWIESNSSESLLIYAKAMPLRTKAEYHRLSSLRLELPTVHVHAGGLLTGCIAYSANRMRVFTRCFIRLKHRTVCMSLDEDREVPRAFNHFKEKYNLPNKFQPHDLDIANGFEVPPGTYFWPFEIQLPKQLYLTGQTKYSYGSQAGTLWTTYLILSVTLKRSSSVKTHHIELTVDSGLFSYEAADAKDENLVLSKPKIKFFGDQPFTPDPLSDHDIDHAVSGSSNSVVEDVERIPAAGCCTPVNKALYG